MIYVIVSSILFCLVLKLAWAGLSAKFIAVALYLVAVYIAADFFLKDSGSYPTPKEVPVDNKIQPTKQINRGE